MTNHRFAPAHLALSTLTAVAAFCVSVTLGALGTAALTGCASGDDPMVTPDAAPPRPIAIAGHYSLHSSFVVTSPPPAVAAVLAELDAMTDGADDPSRYLIDRLIAKLPEGRTHDIALALAPYLAAYVTGKIAGVAPNFAPGTRALATGLDRIAHHFETSEALDIAGDGLAVRAIEGLRWGADAADFSSIAPAITSVTLFDGCSPDGAMRCGPADQLSIASHALRVPYGAMLRLGLERALIPSVVPHASTLRDAFAQLADCERLGAIVSDWVGVGSPGLYSRACTTALTAAAAEISDRIEALDAQPFVLELSGTARAVDRDGDGSMDLVGEGRWTGAFGTGDFDGITR